MTYVSLPKDSSPYASDILTLKYGIWSMVIGQELMVNPDDEEKARDILFFEGILDSPHAVYHN